jgi:hypothetical protein
MGEDTSASIPPELQVLLDLQVTIKGMAAATDHQILQAVLVDVHGVESVSFWEEQVAIRYDPQRVTQHRLHDLITAEGFTISKEESERPAPSVESPEATQS